MFVVSSGAVLRADDVPEHLALREALLAEGDRFTSGGAIIVAPDGSVLAEAEPDVECLLTADLDLSSVREHRHNFDPTGHYGRPDVFDLTIDRGRSATVMFES
jgi:nitrilase